MKGILIIVVILASIGSQAQSVSREAVNSAGATMDNGSYSLSMSLGQIAITTLEQPGNSLTQGFQHLLQLKTFHLELPLKRIRQHELRLGSSDKKN